MDKIINIAVVAHVDAGKSTLVDGLLRQSGVFRDNEELVDCVMDSGDLEKERGITITAKNCAIKYKDYKINIVDTPGHADFSSEIERIIKTVDTVILLVDSAEGPMPQTRFVLSEALKNNLNPILFINKIDKKDQRATEVVDMTFNLFMELGATDEQLDFPILYGSARSGYAIYNMGDEGKDLTPLFETIIKNTKPFEGSETDPLQMQISQLAYDDYIGRLGIGRINKGKINVGETVAMAKNDGTTESFRVTKLFVNEGIKRVEVNTAFYGDIVTVAGCSHVSIGDTICDKNHIEPLPKIVIEEPTLSMNFMVNDSPFAGQTGKFVTSRNIRERLEKELEVNVGLKVEETDSTDTFKVSGRGELHLTILLEQMRREGYEIAVSRPEVILKKIDGVTCEPVEEVVIDVPTEYSGNVISSLNVRKGVLSNMEEIGSYTRITYMVPTRGLIGFRSDFINMTHGEGTLVQRLADYEPFKGEIPQRENGALISTETGGAMTYALWNIQERGQLFIGAQTPVYEGMIIGVSAKNMDMGVNPIKNKKMTAVRSTGNDEAMKLVPPRVLTLESAIEFINDDELVEITPTDIRVRKKYLTEIERRRHYREIGKIEKEAE